MPLRPSAVGLLLVPLISGNLACGVVASATKSGMMPILRNGIDGFVAEPDLEIAEGALVSNLKLIEGVAATYPDDPEPLIMLAMARANYAFGFIIDELEAFRIAYPGESDRSEALLARALINFDAGRRAAEQVLRSESDSFGDAVADKTLEELSQETISAALATLEKDDATALFWLAFNWGGAIQAASDPALATQLPKIEAMIARTLELDETVFYGAGPNLLAGTLHGFRSPALGGNQAKSEAHFKRASELAGGLLLASVMTAQYVYAQTEKQDEFYATLNAALTAETNTKLAAFEALARRKACRLLANADAYFLDDPKPLPDACRRVSHKHPLREVD